MERGSTSLSPNTMDVVAYGFPKMEPKHQVFLSHSGAQKGFVEQLCVDLKGCDRRPFFDKDWDSLPIGSNFPTLIFDAIKHCDVGVVVLSEEFFTSKWPMLELVAMVDVQKEKPSFTILPIFLGISIEKFRDANTRKSWLSLWQSFAACDSRIDVDAWEGALQLFGPTNALIYNIVLGEVKFRAQIVEAICKLVPPSTRFEDSHVQGRTRLCKMIYQRLKECSPTSDGVYLVGIYGVGGIGKTTICKSMCNEFSTEYPFKVAHVELGSQSEAELFKKVLGRLSNKKMDQLAVMDKDEYRDHLMRDMVNVKVFLAIDNVSSATSNQALTLLKGKYGRRSVLLVTARSLDQLTCLGIAENKCMEMPELELEEARSLFLSHTTRIPPSNLRNIDDHDLISSCVGRCRFKKGDGIGYHYHPLALKVLGEQLQNIKYDQERWLSHLCKIDSFNPFGELEHPLLSILRVSFDDLNSEHQLLFMDVALFTPYMVNDFRVAWNLFEWLGMVHGLSETSVMEGLETLKRKSLVENLGDGRVRVGMHDLWREFAKFETTVGKFEERRWIFEWGQSNVLEEACVSRDGCFHNLRRMSISYHKGFTKLRSLNFPHLTVLKLLVDFRSAPASLDLKGLKQLRSLELERKPFGSGEPMVSVVGLGSLSQLAFLRWSGIPSDSSCIAEIGCLSNLRVLELWKCSRFPDLSRLIDLQVVCLTRNDSSPSIAGLSPKHTNLQFLDLSYCRSLMRCPGVGELVALQELRLDDCWDLKELPSLHKLQRLRKLDVRFCLSLRALPGLGELVSLLELRARFCSGLAELPDMRKLRNLRVLDLRHCTRINSLPGLSKLTNLQTLELWSSAPLQSFAGWSDLVSLRSLHAGTAEFHDGPDLRKLTKLERLRISGWRGQGFSSLAELVLLTSVTVKHCKGVRVLPDLRRLSSLRHLVFRRCEFEDLSGLCKLAGLEALIINYCDKLESLPDLRELVGLERLQVDDCERLRDIRGILGLHNLEELSAHRQPWLHESLGLDHQQLTGLRDLDVSDGGFANMRHLTCRNCPIEEFPDLASFPSLSTLDLCGCENLTDLSCSGPLSPDLSGLDVSGCKLLQGLPDLTHSQELEYLDVSDSGVVLSAELIQYLEARWPNLRLNT